MQISKIQYKKTVASMKVLEVFWKMLILPYCTNAFHPLSNLQKKPFSTYPFIIYEIPPFSTSHPLLKAFATFWLGFSDLPPFGLYSKFSSLSQKYTRFNKMPALMYLLQLFPFHSGLSPGRMLCSLPLCHSPLLGWNTPSWASNLSRLFEWPLATQNLLVTAT